MYKDENMELSRDEIDIPEEKKDSQGTVKETKAEEKERRISEFRQHLKNKKTISQNEISDYFCEIEMDSEEMDDIYGNIFSLGIDVITAKDNESLDEISDEDFDSVNADVEEVPDEEELEEENLAKGIAVDDPVRMYLKEIGKVPLLKAEEERELTRRSRSEERRVGKECRSRWSPYH